MPKNHANEESDKSERTKANTNRTDASNETTKSLLKPEDGPMKARRNSADSTVSHIVWSAVVEKFSEMAQEIAGVDPPREKVSNHNADSAIPVSSNPISPSATATCPISSKLEMRNENTASDVPPSPQVGSQDLENVAQEAKTSITEKAGVSSTEVRCEETDTQLNTVETASNAIPTVPLTKDSDSPATGSIMKKGHGAGLVDDGEMSDTPSGKSNKHNVIKLKRGKTVRVQSHHASLNVEGDYAAFLKKAIVEHERDSDATSVRSGKSNRSGRSAAWSTKSGVENGCFRCEAFFSVIILNLLTNVLLLAGGALCVRSRRAKPLRPLGTCRYVTSAGKLCKCLLIGPI